LRHTQAYSAGSLAIEALRGEWAPPKVAISSDEAVDRAATKSLPAGTFVHLPAGMPHYAMADAEAIVQINGTVPFDVIYVDPKDNRRKK
jgi:hypothetical protein